MTRDEQLLKRVQRLERSFLHFSVLLTGEAQAQGTPEELEAVQSILAQDMQAMKDDVVADHNERTPDLLRELKHLVALLEPLELNGGLNVPGLATLNGARDAIRKAEGK